MKQVPQNMVVIIVLVLLAIGTLVFTIRHYDEELSKANKQNEDNKAQVKQLKKQNKKQSDIIARQDEKVVTKEEQDIRDQSKKFVKTLFTLKPKQDYKEKEKILTPILDKKYKKELFEDVGGKNNLFGKVDVSNVKTFLEEYRPQNDTYDVYVQFEEKEQDVDEEDSTTSKTSGKIHFVRKNDKWLIDNFERFTLERNKSGDPK